MGGLNALIVQGDALEPKALSATLPTFCVVTNQSPTPFETMSVQFNSAEWLPAALRRRRMVTPGTDRASALQISDSHDVLATIEDRPVWAGDAAGREFVSVPLPELEEGQQLSEFLNGEFFLRLLPLYLFLRRLTDEGWESPPLRACLLVDDPNLRSQTYGRIDYRKLVTLAERRRFHGAMATIPLDAWQVSPRAARIFREHSAQLSLLIHGNNHTRFELARMFSEERGLSLLAEALRRADALEKKSGVEISRVMAPPHGVCLESMLRAMFALGFAGVTTNRWSLWKFNDLSRQPAWIGLRPANMFAGGLPVVNRFRFNSSIAENEAVIAALLGQPIIPYGHHQDFADDMTAVTKIVDSINSLGDVRWMNMSDILRTNFESRLEGDTLQLRLFSREVHLTLPASVSRLQIVSTDDGAQRFTICAEETAASSAHFGETVAVKPR